MATQITPKRKRANTRVVEQAKSGTARAALLGVSDGLVTNVSFILGVAGAGVAPEFVRIAGLASLIAGAGSMAVGEYISMRGQVELLEGVLAAEQEQLENSPEQARAALKEVLIADGMTDKTAAAGSNEVAADAGKAMAMYARGKLGINPDELGSAWGSAASSLVMFSLGAFVPLVPWFFGGGLRAIAISLGLSVLSALGIGSYLGYTTGGRMVKPALRQLFVLILAASVTYGIGRLFHVQVG